MSVGKPPTEKGVKEVSQADIFEFVLVRCDMVTLSPNQIIIIIIIIFETHKIYII